MAPERGGDPEPGGRWGAPEQCVLLLLWLPSWPISDISHFINSLQQNSHVPKIDDQLAIHVKPVVTVSWYLLIGSPWVGVMPRTSRTLYSSSPSSGSLRGKWVR